MRGVVGNYEEEEGYFAPPPHTHFGAEKLAYVLMRFPHPAEVCRAGERPTRHDGHYRYVFPGIWCYSSHAR